MGKALASPLVQDRSAATYDRVTEAMRAYLKTMGVSDRLLPAMLKVPPHRIKVLTRHEMQAFGLLGQEPARVETPAGGAPLDAPHNANQSAADVVHMVSAAGTPRLRAPRSVHGKRRARAQRRDRHRRAGVSDRRRKRPAGIATNRPHRLSARAQIRSRVNVNAFANFGAGSVGR
jgi:hypothetical protein